MCLFYSAFLSAAHWITIVDAASLDSLNACLKAYRISEFGTAISQYIFKTDINSYVPRRFSKRSKVSLTAPLVHRLSKKARNSFSFVKNSVRRVLFDSLEEWTVSISTKDDRSNEQKSE